MSQADVVVIELTGEGKTDVGKPSDEPEKPEKGVVPVLVFALCDRPGSMRVKRRPVLHLQGKGLWQKVRFAKRQAYYNGSAGAVFVKDTEGDLHGTVRELQRGRAAELPDFPMAIGTPHPCLEAWLLCDPAAIRSALGLAELPLAPDDPEGLPAPRDDRNNNPKSVLHRCAGGMGSDLSAAEKTRITSNLRELQRVRERCPQSFAPFADEIHARIKSLFP
jgi:hypothetical protein